MYAGQNDEHDYLDYAYASLNGLHSINQPTVGRLRNYAEKTLLNAIRVDKPMLPPHEYWPIMP